MKEGIFAFHMPVSKGEPRKGEVLLPDFQWDRQENILRPLPGNGSEKTQGIQTWKAIGQIPVVVILILALTEHIRGAPHLLLFPLHVR